MQITSIDGQGSLRGTSGPAGQDVSPGAERTGVLGLSTADQITLSESARELAAAYRIVDATPWIREGVVRSVRDALASGRYAVDTRELAVGMGGLS